MQRKARLSDQVVIRLPSDLRQAIEAAADQDRRNPSSLIRIVLEDWVKTRAAAQQHAA